MRRGTPRRIDGACRRAGTSDVVDAAVAIAESNTQQVDDEIALLKSDTADLRTLLPEVAAGARIVDV
ncbi:MAG: hypothetical protein OXF41_14395 [bacterium]|nr:hypothetical protein [bacterium]